MEKLFLLFFLMTAVEQVEQVEARAEPGLIESLVVAANSRPWLWSVYVFTVGLPVILFISFMWPDKRFGPPDQPYYYKKSDEVQEDDPEPSPLTKPTLVTPGSTPPEPSPLTKPTLVTPGSTPDEPKEPGPRRREVQRNMRNMRKSDLELKVE